MSTPSRSSVKEALRNAAEMLSAASDTARLDAELIMAQHLGVTRSQMLLNHMDGQCPEGFEADCARRRAHEPVAYILGEQEFFGLPFKVGPGVLIPRGDSEVLVETALEMTGTQGRVLDLGTGSGALLLAFLANRPQWSGLGVDQSPCALDHATRNTAALGLANNAAWQQRDWTVDGWANGAEKFDLILCNPPYVEDGASIEPDVRDYEPARALFAGNDGLNDYKILIPEIRSLMRDGGTAIFEIGAAQGDAVRAIAHEAGFSTEVRKDLANRPRAVVLR